MDTYELADGSRSYSSNTYRGTVIEIDGFDPHYPFKCQLHDLWRSEPIIGVDVIRHFSVILDHGRRVIVEP